jgi:hypothetical protein
MSVLAPIAVRRGTSVVVVASRVLHGLLAALLLCCIGLVYLGAWTGRADVLTLLAVALLGIEGTLVLRSGGDCPLRPAFRWLGDDRPFFELFLPAHAARLAVPVLGGIAASGVVLLGLRTL